MMSIELTYPEDDPGVCIAESTVTGLIGSGNSHEAAYLSLLGAIETQIEASVEAGNLLLRRRDEMTQQTTDRSTRPEQIAFMSTPALLSKLPMNGWRFEYCDETQFVAANHENGKGKFSVCEVVTPTSRGDRFRVAVGNAIAACLNNPPPNPVDGEDRPTRPEQITSAATPIRYIQAGERLMEDIRRQEAGACMAAVRATKQRRRRTWPGVLVALLVAALLGAVLVACVGCSVEHQVKYEPTGSEDMLLCAECNRGPICVMDEEPNARYYCDHCAKVVEEVFPRRH